MSRTVQDIVEEVSERFSKDFMTEELREIMGYTISQKLHEAGVTGLCARLMPHTSGAEGFNVELHIVDMDYPVPRDWYIGVDDE